MNKLARVLVALTAATMGAGPAWAAKKAPAPTVSLTAPGQELEAGYRSQMDALQAEITKALPSLNDRKQAAYLKAREAEVAAEAGLEAAKQDMGAVGRAQGLVAHAKGKWIGGADKGIADSKAKIANAKTDAERKAAEQELAKWEQNRKEGEAALKERQAQLDQALKDQARNEKVVKQAEEAVAEAKARTAQSMKDLGLHSVLTSDKLDAKLARFVVLHEATPAGLAAFAEQGAEQQKLVDAMLADDDLLVQMAVADGAAGGKYGQAIKIYTDIQKASAKSHEGNLQRLALAVAIEHATPIAQRNPVADTTGSATVDPVGRYLHYEKAFLNGELDPAFKNFSTWEYRYVIDGEEPDRVATWGREMLRNYRPDQVTTPDYRWRYVESVRTDIRYGSQDNQYDEENLQFFPNILKNGGVCGRRAFFGRFILRAFGIPNTARPQKGHAALVHWTPDGWVPCLGAGWGNGWTKTRYNKDLDFLANTQARATGDAFLQVKRAQWIGDVVGEPQVFGFESGNPGFWYGTSLQTQRDLIAAAKSKTLDAVGQDIAEANETKEAIVISKVTLTEEERKIHADKDGVITIPAAATSKPTQSTGKIIFMDSVLGGKQMHYSRNGGEQEFEYTFNAPAAGRYALTARVVTPSWKQSLLVTANDAQEPVEMPLPFTVGLWDTSKPVAVELVKGRNVLRFAHKSDGFAKGFSIRDFTLTPASSAVSSSR